ncbi:uncharacterized protein MKK02DRAFT_39771 [Dioszegia hungarica]|uniref:F-box domain-containing protein n=1 Tax=Dioszegia hungarica TaxID=4972 RepID=A0AA38HFU3_9TREE|nr:uncharacterized protein MKK02DRAFT_39771 [Dioszegia hungarica]KAI9639472.1 hypothetical protein MKK02DRAFT_39771 [Dioszegia hungarica]
MPTPSSSPPQKQVTLPVEVWLQVFQHLQRPLPKPRNKDNKRWTLRQPHLAKLLRVSKYFYNIAAPLLYSTIVTDSLPILISDIHHAPIAKCISKRDLLKFTTRLYIEYSYKHGNTHTVPSPMLRGLAEYLASSTSDPSYTLESVWWDVQEMKEAADLADAWHACLGTDAHPEPVFASLRTLSTEVFLPLRRAQQQREDEPWRYGDDRRQTLFVPRKLPPAIANAPAEAREALAGFVTGTPSLRSVCYSQEGALQLEVEKKGTWPSQSTITMHAPLHSRTSTSPLAIRAGVPFRLYLEDGPPATASECRAPHVPWSMAKDVIGRAITSAASRPRRTGPRSYFDLEFCVDHKPHRERTGPWEQDMLVHRDAAAALEVELRIMAAKTFRRKGKRWGNKDRLVVRVLADSPSCGACGWIGDESASIASASTVDSVSGSA